MRMNKRKGGPELWYALAVIAWAMYLLIVTAVLLPRGAEAHEAEIPVLVIEPAEVAETATAIPGDNVEAAEPVAAWLRTGVPLESEVQEALYAACTETGLRYELALAVVRKETDYRNVVGDGGESYGYMQVQPKWHAERMERLGVTDLMDPAGNFLVACDYLAELLGQYDLPQALTAYNSGKPGESEYARTVMGYMEELGWGTN